MSRPKPTILLTKELTETTGIDILNAVSLYAVLYKLQPINIKQRYFCISCAINKYPKTVFTTVAPARNLAEKLNTEFNTLDFTVTKIL
jgi:ribosomal protein S26